MAQACFSDSCVDGDVDGSSQIANYSYHFDAHLVSKFLRKKAEERGIIRVEGIVKNFIQDSDSNIRVIELNDKKIECDFVFDCSGFKRLIIGNLFKSPCKRKEIRFLDWSSIFRRLVIEYN